MIAVSVRRFLIVLPFLIPASSLAQTIEEKARSCSVCHGEAGIPVEKTTPIIWGQAGGYMYLQLDATSAAPRTPRTRDCGELYVLCFRQRRSSLCARLGRARPVRRLAYSTLSRVAPRRY